MLAWLVKHSDSVVQHLPRLHNMLGLISGKGNEDRDVRNIIIINNIVIQNHFMHMFCSLANHRHENS